MEGSKKEVEVFFKIISGEMRIGVSEGIMLEGIAQAADVSIKFVRRALTFTGDIGKVARIAIVNGLDGLKKILSYLYPYYSNTFSFKNIKKDPYPIFLS